MPAARKLDNAGKRLGQWLELGRPFAALWLPLSAWGVSLVDGRRLWPVNLTLSTAAGQVSYGPSFLRCISHVPV